jgi:hypothetical protein
MTRAELVERMARALDCPDGKCRWKDCGAPAWRDRATAALAAIEAAGVVLIMPEVPDDPGEILDESTLRRMMRDPRYWRSREPEFVKRVTNGFRKLVGG